MSAEPRFTLPDPAAAASTLADCQEPFLIGVRHHSPMLAVAVPAMLDAFAPEQLFVELPANFQHWIPWLSSEELVAPVALAGVSPNGDDLGFYPFADFSPELAAVRWARDRSCEVIAFDLPLHARAREEREVSGRPELRISEALAKRAGARDGHVLWQNLVEGRAVGASSEELRRASLLYGWAMRVEAASGQGVRLEDRRREAFMRAQLAKASGRCAALVGAFHASALLPQPQLFEAPESPLAGAEDTEADLGEAITSLICYSFELLDDRSGYPAGIRDPGWQQRVYEAAGDTEALDSAAARAIVEVCAQVRRDGHVAGVPDATEAVRMARDLSRIRGLASPTRNEILEAIQSCLAQGQPLGRGRALASALDQVFVGRQRGRLSAQTPRSGLAPHVEALIRHLNLPGPGLESKESVDLRLDPLRSQLDRRRHVALERLSACGIPYATLAEGQAAGGIETLTRTWQVRWQPATEAMLELAGLRGVTLATAAAGALRSQIRSAEVAETLTFRTRLSTAAAAAQCGLVSLVSEYFEELSSLALDEATLSELIEAHHLVTRVVDGHVPGLPASSADAVVGEIEAYTMATTMDPHRFIEAGVRNLEGLLGSEQVEDARAALELVQLHQTTELGRGQLLHQLHSFVANGSGVMHGAALGLLVILEVRTSSELGERMGAWVDAAATKESRDGLSKRLAGVLSVAGPLFEAAPEFCQGLLSRVSRLSDAGFLDRLPALREGFDSLSPASRQRLLDVLSETLGEGSGQSVEGLEHSPALLAVFAAADRAGVAAMDLPTALDLSPIDAQEGGSAQQAGAHEALGALSTIDRWRLLLGRERENMTPAAQRYSYALEDLYGRGTGEGSRSGNGQGGGREASFPTVRAWKEELKALFDEQVCEQVIGQAIGHGQSAALLDADLDALSPSVELLEQVLSLKGGLGEAQLAELRRLVSRIADSLVQELAIRIAPALSGLTMPRPTRRRGGRLNLPRTIAANLKRATRDGNGTIRIAPEDLIFATRGKRTMDWRIVLVVDVSGSMEPSVIYSAMMAAILSRVPWVTVNFVAFNTQIIDLSGHVDDPLGLLLEIDVGGGTHIAKGLRYASQIITVPSRTLVICLSDFEEGYPVPALLSAVRSLVDSGVTPLGLAALDDTGKPRYCKSIASRVVAAGMPIAALTPLELARWIGERIRD